MASIRSSRGDTVDGRSAARDALVGLFLFARAAIAEMTLRLAAHCRQPGVWDQWLIAIGAGIYSPHDRNPFSEMVVDCTVPGATIGCDGTPHGADSQVTGGFLALETGYQLRFRPWQGVSLSPGLLTGYLLTVSGPNRSIADCNDCDTVALDVQGSGLYAAPFFG